jgi:EAL domain-containing protein (putative c-di-GMP-specific phosphodiesterase class I)/DNA-binding response OmpR family regulator
MGASHIMFVCGNSSLVAQVEKLLAGAQYVVRVAESWAAAMRDIHKERCDLVLGWVEAADTDSEQMRLLMRDRTVQELIPVVVITPASADVEFFLTLLKSGASYQISLPCGEDYFLDRIAAIIREHRKSRMVDEKIRVDFIHGDHHHVMYLQKRQIVNYLLSTYIDEIEQKKMLSRAYSTNDFFSRLENRGSIKLSGRSLERIKIEEDMIRAIENREFLLFYQPIVSLATGRITGFEALIRWQNEERGFVSPSEFIPQAEESGLIISLGFWVIEEAARQLKIWHEMFKSEQPLTVSVNLSTVQFIHPELAEEIASIVREAGIPFDSLRFEITESALMTDMESANIMLLKLKKMNFRLYMDDFGTGYSSLSYLRHFPVDVLKIDQSFVRWMGIDDESEQIVNTIVHLAKNLKKEVIAEGIETADNLEVLRRLGCEYGQGYLFSKPLSAGDAEELLKKNPFW